MNDLRKPVQLAGIITSMSHTKDRGLRIGFVTQELNEEELNEIMKYFQLFGYVLFKPNEFQDSDIPKGDIEKKGLTLSQRLRNVLYVYWQQINTNQTFDEFYREKMENIIAMVKNKLNV